jgi:acyl-CoA reductase-like NAD-dependent aldehyde dehydrogenase
LIDLVIDGESRPASSGKTFERTDPVTGLVASTVAAASPEDVDAAVAAAKAAFAVWSQQPPVARRMVLLKAADLLEERTEDFIKLMMSEGGATGPWGGFNVSLAASMLREAAAMTTQISGEVLQTNKPDSLSLAVRRPLGVCVGIAPWNAPVILGVRAVAMALACGNTIVLKGSELTPGTHALIVEVLQSAGLPAGAINYIVHAREDAPGVMAALVQHPDVAHVNFTGSTRVGKIVAKLAAEHLKPVLLELGGKAPLVVLDDANVAGAVNAASFGCYMNQGQICMSTERLVVDEKVADEFVAMLGERVTGLSAGDPRGDSPLGSVVSSETGDRMVALIEDAVAKGAVVVAGGGREGAIVQPTLIDHATPEMRIYNEESFGPVKSVVRVSGDDEAVRVANDTNYGLSAAVFSENFGRAYQVAAQIDSGICHINGSTVDDEAQAPFGGVKGSGYGRFGGKAVIDQFTVLRWITIEDAGQHYPF